MLTQKDFDEIEKILDQKLDEKFDQRFSHLPTKDDFFNKMDEVMGELKAIREERETQADVLSDHGDRLEKLENLHPELQVAA